MVEHDFDNHLLRKNHSRGMPANCIFFDTETTEVEKEAWTEHHFRMAWTCRLWRHKDGSVSRESWLFWSDPALLCRYLDESAWNRNTLYVFSHNIFFDLQVIGAFKHLAGWGWKLDFVYESGLTYILNIRKGSKRICFLSTTNFFQCSLKELGNLVGLEKMDVDPLAANDDILREYCRRDVEIIRRAMLAYMDFLVENRLGRFSFTIPSQAMHAFRHRFMTAKIYVHQYPPVSGLERNAYFGGRVECGYIGEVPDGPFVQLDVNGMYPYVMTKYPLPTRLIDYREDLRVDQLAAFLDRYHAVAHVKVRTDKPLYAVRRDGKVIFPVGEFDCYLNTFMLKEAIGRDHLLEVYKAAFYEKAYVFGDYISFFFSERTRHEKQGNRALRYMCKLFMNSLYGKFGQKRPLLEISECDDALAYNREEIFDMVTGETILVYRLFGKEVRVEGWEEHKASMVAIASHITEAARLELWRWIELVGADNVCYCDTDSLIVREKHLTRLAPFVDPYEMGLLKAEKVHEQLTIFGLKHYRSESVHKCKGVPKNAVQLDDRHFRYASFLKQASHMRLGIPDRVVCRQVDKHLTGIYDKGWVTPSGRVRPFRVSPLHPP